MTHLRFPSPSALVSTVLATALFFSASTLAFAQDDENQLSDAFYRSGLSNDQTEYVRNQPVDSTMNTTDHVQRILRAFGNPGWRDSYLYDNTSLETSAFDFIAYRTHHCFEPVGLINQLGCKRRFGPSANLKQAMLSGSLDAAIIAEFGASIAPLLANFHADLLLSHAASAGYETMIDTRISDMRIRDNLRARSQTVWDACWVAFGTDLKNRNACFRNNFRLINSFREATFTSSLINLRQSVVQR